MTKRVGNAATIAAAGIAGLIVWGPWPLGVPGQWTWVSIESNIAFVIPLLVLALIGWGVVRLVDAVAARVGQANRSTWFTAVLALVVMLFIWVTFTRVFVDDLKLAAGVSRDPFVLHSEGTSGYFSVARDMTNTAAFVDDYEAFVAEGDFLHQGTHPPGLVLLYRGLFWACESFPAVTTLANSLMSTSVSDSFDVITETMPPPLTRVERAVLWWAGVGTQMAVALCVVPITGLLRRLTDRETTLRVAGLWLFVPSAVVFLPKSDCLYAVVGLTVAWLWCLALDGSRVAAFASGLTASLALWLTLAFGPLYVGLAIGSFWWAGRTRWKTLCQQTALAIIGGILPVVYAGLFCGMNLVTVWIGNLRNHATFYDHNERTYAAWLPVNFLEGLVSFGLPVIAAAAVCLLANRRSGNVNSQTGPSAVCAITVGVLAAWALLWLSGKNMGEAARLWVLFSPWPVVGLGVCWRDANPFQWRIVAWASLAAYLAVVLRVDGFDLTGRAIGL